MLVLLLGIFVMLAIYLASDRRIDPRNQIAAVTETASTSAALSSTSTVASEGGSPSAASPSASKQAATPDASAVRSSAGSTVIETRAVSDPQGRLCTANDLSGMASWARTGSYLTGTLRIKNSSSSDCVLSPSSRLSIFSGLALLTDRQTSGPSRGMALPSGSERLVRFTWSNWCGGALRNPGYAVFTLQGSAGYLRVPFISPDGDPQYDAPLCGASALGTSIDVWW